MAKFQKHPDAAQDAISTSFRNNRTDAETYKRAETMASLQFCAASCDTCASSKPLNAIYLHCSRKNKRIKGYNLCELYYKD